MEELPQSWCSVALSEIVEINPGIDKSKFRDDEEMPFVPMPAVEAGTGRIDTRERRSFGKVKSGFTPFASGDVLFAKITPCMENGKMAVVPPLPRGVGFGTTEFHVLRSTEAVDADLVYYFVSSASVRHEAQHQMTGAVGQKRVPKRYLETKRFPLAPLNEQRRIVEKIETLFARLEKGEAALREVQKLLARYRQSVLKAAVTGQLTAGWRAEHAHRLEHGRDLLARILQTRRETWQGRGKYKEPAAPDTTDLPELPEGWVWATVDQVVGVFRNGLSRKPISEPNEFPILRISATRAMSVAVDDLRYYEPTKDEDLSSYWVERGDLLFTRYNGSAHLVGVCGQMRETAPVLYPDKLIKARPIAVEGLSADYLEAAWNTGMTRRHIVTNIKTTSGQQGIAGGDIKAAVFPLPPAKEQALIAELIWDAFDRIRHTLGHCETEFARSAALRQSILKDAFAGRLVPQDPADEPAADLLARIRETRSVAPRKTQRKARA